MKGAAEYACSVLTHCILHGCMYLSKVYYVAANTVQFSLSTLPALSPKSHLSIIHEMEHYPFRALQCELNYLDLKWRGCLSDNLVLCNASNSFDVVGKAKCYPLLCT